MTVKENTFEKLFVYFWVSNCFQNMLGDLYKQKGSQEHTPTPHLKNTSNVIQLCVSQTYHQSIRMSESIYIGECINSWIFASILLLNFDTFSLSVKTARAVSRILRFECSPVWLSTSHDALFSVHHTIEYLSTCTVYVDGSVFSFKKRIKLYS